MSERYVSGRGESQRQGIPCKDGMKRAVQKQRLCAGKIEKEKGGAKRWAKGTVHFQASKDMAYFILSLGSTTEAHVAVLLLQR